MCRAAVGDRVMRWYCVCQAAGMANSTGMTPDDIMRVSLFPELTRMSCSMFGAWGPATANTASKLVQLRALVGRG